MLACAGGGIYFFWQAGAMRAIRASGLVNLEACQFRYYYQPMDGADQSGQSL
jgi:hypothetical protein